MTRIGPREIKQNVYDHGGSRIWTEDEKGNRNLIADSYLTKKFADDLRQFVEKWLSENETTGQ